jgi:hypothetical protein
MVIIVLFVLDKTGYSVQDVQQFPAEAFIGSKHLQAEKVSSCFMQLTKQFLHLSAIAYFFYEIFAINFTS